MSPIAYSVPITAVAAAKLTATQWNASVRDNILFLANPPACRVYHNTTQSIPDATETSVAFNAERFDPTGMHDTATLNGRITIATAGIYVVSFSGEFAAAIDYPHMYALCRKNGTTVVGRSTANRHDSGDGSPAAVSFSFVDKFDAADYLEIRVYQNNTANVARNLMSTNRVSPEFAACWMGLG